MSITQTPQPNTIYFVWINPYSGVQIKTPTKTLLIDPVEVKAKDYPHVDALLITHEHYDHLEVPLVAAIQNQTGCTVIADAASAKKLKDTIPPEKLVEAKPGFQTKIGEVSVRAQKSNHNAKAPVTYIITSEDGVKIFHTSDSHSVPEMATLAKTEKFDLVFCTVGVAPGASAETGFEIAWLTKPHLAVPYHAGAKTNQTRFKELLAKKLKKTQCLIPEQNMIYQVSKEKE